MVITLSWLASPSGASLRGWWIRKANGKWWRVHGSPETGAILRTDPFGSVEDLLRSFLVPCYSAPESRVGADEARHADA
jgi:hypothetical protein